MSSAMIQVEVDPDQKEVSKDEDLLLLRNWDGKHPLKNSWVLWYSDRCLAKEWTDCIKEIGPFATVEDFWCLFNFLKPVSLLKVGCDFYLFKNGIQPMWEDKYNKEGGRWDILIERSLIKQQIDGYWMELVMVMVGEGFFGLGAIVNGACVSKRDKNGRISVWTSVANEREKLMFLGKKIKHILGIPRDHNIHFRSHEDSAKPASRQNNSLYVC